MTLTKDERTELKKSLLKKNRSQKVLDALILLGCYEGEYQDKQSTNEEMSRVLKTSMRKINRVKKRFVVNNLEVALNGRKRSRVYARKADVDFTPTWLH